MDLEKLKNVSVLLVDDDEDDYLIIKKIFERIDNSPFSLEWVSSYDKARQLIESEKHDVYLIDYLLGEKTGLDLLKDSSPEQRSQPFILLTGVGNESVEWKSLELAAADYLVKGAFDANLLQRTLFYALQRKYFESQRVEYLMDLNRSKDEFISIASHQLRTPATGVKQYVGMLLEGFAGDFTEQQRMLLQRAYESNERQLKIVSDLLKVAQVDAGKIMLRKSLVSLNEIVEEVIKELASVFQGRSQQVDFTPAKNDPKVEVDAASVRMVLENIIDNASKYSPDDSTISVTVSSNKKCASVSVADNGVGIDSSAAWRLFEKFSRIDNSLSTKVGGTGLGLYWAKKIVDLHGGTISYAQNEPHGTVFRVKLPKNDKV